jgi:hypothetical protein
VKPLVPGGLDVDAILNVFSGPPSCRAAAKQLPPEIPFEYSPLTLAPVPLDGTMPRYERKAVGSIVIGGPPQRQ